MPYALGWYIEQKVYRINYLGEVSYDDMKAVGDRVLDILDTSSERLQMLFDMRAVERILPTINTLDSRPQVSRYYTHPKLHWTVYVGEAPNPFLQMITRILAMRHDARIRWTYSLEEALSFLQDVDPSIPIDCIRESL